MAMIERHEDDTPKSYAALCDYAALGPSRSIDKLLQFYTSSGIAKPPTKHRASLGVWSSQHDWQARARAYDDMLALEASAAHTAQYIASLEAHRKRAQDAGEGVYIVAAKLLQRRTTELDTVEITPATLGVLLRAFQTALDLEAHALGVDALLPALEQQEAR
jgi:hypothetical protein